MKKRTRTRKTTKSTTKSTKSPNVILWVALGAAAVLLIILAIFIIAQSRKPDWVAKVNGEQVMQNDLDFQYNLLPESYRALFTREQVLEQIIDETLVVQAAERAGVNVSQEEVLAKVQSILEENQISTSEFAENLAQFNVTTDQFEALIKRQIMIERYLNTTLELSAPQEEALQALYNVSDFRTKEQVTVRHVLIAQQREDAAVIAKQVYELARNGSDMCALAQNYSDDRGSRDKCGEYTFPRGFMDPAFENASFEMQDGEVRLVQTRFGYHIIKRINFTPEGVQPYEQVRDQLVTQYMAAQRSAQYRLLISDLRSRATIIYANGTRIVPAQPTTVSGPTGDAVSGDEVIVVNETPAEAPAAPNGTENDTAPATETTPAETPTQTSGSSGTTVTIVQREPATDPSAVLQCIASRSTLYGTSWSSDTQEQRRMFGDSLTYVECNTGGMCAGIEAYPTWRINGQLYLGRMTLEELKNAASC